MPATSEPSTPTDPDRQDDLVLTAGRLEVRLRPAQGGRLARLRYGEADLVLPAGQPHGFYGDTFWPSPQSRFDWPPPPALDADPYEVLAADPTGAVLRSAPDPTVGLQVTKRFAVSADTVDFAFTLTNVWSHEQRVAPWQVTRAAREGLLVWAPGAPFTDADRVVKHREDPPCWYHHADLPAPFPGLATGGAHASISVAAVPWTSKYHTDAQGWLAHLHRGTLVLRQFPDLRIDQAAPRQAELELYFDLERDYIELENQGDFRMLAPGESLQYATRWRFAATDPAMAPERVTPELIEAIEDLARAGRRSGRDLEAGAQQVARA